LTDHPDLCQRADLPLWWQTAYHTLYHLTLLVALPIG